MVIIRGPLLGEKPYQFATLLLTLGGLYDMHGNVLVWFSDWYGENYYIGSHQKDPQVPLDGSGRVCRGGSWFHFEHLCRSACRNNSIPGKRNFFMGFRIIYSK
jgi:formylglycine-generating enzyme required for sulfatase activity